MGMEEDELSAFRERWKQELKKNTKTSSKDTEGYFGHPSKDSSSLHQSTSFWEKRSSALQQSQPAPTDQPQYVSIAEGLLDGRSSPLLDRIEQARTRRKRAPESDALNTDAPPKKGNKCQKLLEQFLQDLNEVNDIPFFDVELPYELALKIFHFLGRTDLGRCAQVSKSWKVLAEDEVLWHRLCLEEGYYNGASISDSPCWKSTLRDCRNTENIVKSNWKVDGILVVPGRRDFPLVTAWAGESVYLLDSRWNEEQELRVLHSVYGHPVTCVDVSPSRAALGIKSCGWGMNDGGNKIQVYSLETSQCELTVGNSAGDFTCVNLRDSHPHLLVCGNKDRRSQQPELHTEIWSHHHPVFLE